MVGCAAPGCKSGYDGKLPIGVTCHLLPKDKEIRKKWIQAIPREDWTPSASARICSLHFEEEDFVKERTDSNPNRQRGELQRRRLKPNVVPHIFPNCPFYLSKKTSLNVLKNLQVTLDTKGQVNRQNPKQKIF